MKKLLLLLVSVFFLQGCANRRKPAEKAPPVRIVLSDLDKDGEAEVVIENDYLKLVALLPQGKGVEKYDTRFVWGGCITDVISKPTGLNHVIGKYYRDGDIDWNHPHYLGLPDQFEKRVSLDATEVMQSELLIGVGILARQKSPTGKWSKWTLAKTAPWTFQVEDRADGGKTARFTQNLTTDYGYAYELTRRIRVEPESSVFRIETTLRNTGNKPIHTDWYLHPFFAYGGYGGECWQEIPLSIGEKTGARTESYALPTMQSPGTVWGWLTSPELGGESWFATGGGGKELFFAARWDFPLLRLRNWLRGHTYAIEPFTKIDLPPGKDSTWGMDIILGSGMSRVAHVNRHGAFDARMPKADQFEILFMPTTPIAKGNIHIRIESQDGVGIFDETRKIKNCEAGATRRIPVDVLLPDESPVRVQVTVTEGTAKRMQAARIINPQKAVPGPPAKRLAGKRVLIVSDSNDRTRRNELLYLCAALRREGASIESASPAKLPALSPFDAVVLLSATGLDFGDLRRYVESGGGLFATAPFDISLRPLLPIDGIPERIEMTDRPKMPERSGDPRAENIPALRNHLVPGIEHPIHQGLPLYPQTYQSIGTFYRVKAKRDSAVVLRYSHGSSPALVIDSKKRIAAFMSPLAWGEPPHWILWGAFSEYHRELMTRIVIWCCGGEKGT
ncbi:MAG: hypothetical protein GXP25_17080 [Planctomycetes bacterium]|nr:hypothetical protein [Planctomycetota bacterium]